MRNRREKASGFDGDRRYLFFVYAPVAEPAAGKGASGIFSVSFDQWISGRGMRDGCHFHDMVSETSGLIIIDQAALRVVMDHAERS